MEDRGLREQLLFLGEGGVNRGDGINFSADKMIWAKFQCKPLEGVGQNFSAQTFEGHPEATKIQRQTEGRPPAITNRCSPPGNK